MAVIGGIKCIKYLMFIFNLFFWVGGLHFFFSLLSVPLDEFKRELDTKRGRGFFNVPGLCVSKWRRSIRYGSEWFHLWRVLTVSECYVRESCSSMWAQNKMASYIDDYPQEELRRNRTHNTHIHTHLYISANTRSLVNASSKKTTMLCFDWHCPSWRYVYFWSCSLQRCNTNIFTIVRCAAANCQIALHFFKKLYLFTTCK